MSEQLGALAHEEGAAAKQVTGRSPGPGIDVGHRPHAAVKQAGDTAGVDAIVLDLGAMHGPHVERMSEDKGDVVLFTDVGKPVPVERRFHPNGDLAAERR